MNWRPGPVLRRPCLRSAKTATAKITVITITLLNLAHETQRAAAFGYVSVGFANFTGLLGLTLLAMFLNKNQVYSVLYLGLLSLLAIVMWMYYLEVNFILIVYILAFIGAIVMLFMSVVLMLPSSTLEGTAQQTLFWTAAVTVGAENASSLLWNSPILSAAVNLLAVLAFIDRLGGWAILQHLRARVGTNTTTSLLGGLPLRAIEDFLLLIQQAYAAIRTDGVWPALSLAWGRFQSRRHGFDFLGQTSYKALYSTLVLLAAAVFTGSTAPRSNTVHSENLVGIKNSLYVDQPLFLLVSVIGLLIALFGVTVITLETRKAVEGRRLSFRRTKTDPVALTAG